MLFSSLTFIFLFLPVVLAVYYLAPLKIRNLLLLLASLIFYAWGEPVYVVLMILSILLNYCCGREIAANAEDERKAHRGMIFTVVVNLALLLFFKYYGFFLELVNSVTLPRTGSAGGDFFLYFSGHFLCGGCLSGKSKGTEESFEFCTLYRPVPATDRWTDRAV